VVGAEAALHRQIGIEYLDAGLAGAMRWLDARLADELAAVEHEYGAPGQDPFRGLYVSQRQAEDLLARQLPDQIASAEEPRFAIAGQLGLLAERFELTDSDLKLLVVALAPELDLRYERIYGYLQDDVTRRRATVELALRVAFGPGVGRWAGRSRFWPDSPLLRHGLLEPAMDAGQPNQSSLAASLIVDEQVVRIVLGFDLLDPRLKALCRLEEPGTGRSLTDATTKRVAELCGEHARQRSGIRLYLQERSSGSAVDLARTVASAIGAPLLEADLEKLPEVQAQHAGLLRLVLNECRWRGAVLHLRGVVCSDCPDIRKRQQSLLTALKEESLICLMTGSAPLGALGGLASGTIPVTVPGAGYRERRSCWADGLSATGTDLPESDLDALAARFRISTPRIAEAVATAVAVSALRQEAPAAADLFAAARSQSGHELESEAQKVEPRYRWQDIVLTADQNEQLHEICDQVRLRHVVYEDWGFDRKLSLGRGLSILFSGAPGTGKTMAAEVIAGELGLDLFRIDLAQVVSKYIGDTEKRLESIFRHAEATDAVLLFDEAEALFGKRSEVKDSHDRYANIEVAYLLQRMEAYDGVTILATNLRKNLDTAFMRRLQFAVDFPNPDRAMRLEIWRRLWPDPQRLAPDADLEFMADQFNIPGGLIRNIALKAAFLGAQDDGPITLRHLLWAARRELQKMGRVVVDDDFGIHSGLLKGVSQA
jgi:hypothetical protein